jgi:hypothetical protein
MKMQGLYGSLWIDKWRLGSVGPDGLDEGMKNAMEVWADELSGFADTPEAIAHAIAVCAADQYPPNLPQFREHCRDYMRRNQRDILKLEHKLTPEERAQQKAMADKVADLVKSWSKHED